MDDSGFKIVKLDVDNYGTWSIDMKNLLIVKGLGSAIDSDVLQGGNGELTLEEVVPKLQLVEQRLKSGETSLGGEDNGVNAYYAGRVTGVCWHC